MSARATLFHAIHHERTPSRRRLLATLSHAITTAGLLSMMIDSSVTLAPAADLVLTAIVFAVWLYFCRVLPARARTIAREAMAIS